MYQKLITKRFCKDNPLKELSTQRFVYTLLANEGLEQIATEVAREYLTPDPKRLEQADQERAMLATLQDPDVVFQLMRKSVDSVNRAFLIEKSLEFEDALRPLVIDKLIRSNHDTFIDNAIRFLSACKTSCADTLERRYTEIRSPYVKSIVCVLLGLKAAEHIIPWMLDRFYEFKKFYPQENYEQGSLVALYELKVRFYK